MIRWNYSENAQPQSVEAGHSGDPNDMKYENDEKYEKGEKVEKGTNDAKRRRGRKGDDDNKWKTALAEYHCLLTI